VKISHIASVIGLIGAVAVFIGCGGVARNTDTNANGNSVPVESPNVARTNAEELGLLVNMPYEADDVAWKEDAAHKKVTAVLHFSKADADRIVANASSRQEAKDVTLPSETWFPAELIAQGEMSGDDALKGQAFAADEFYLEPYTAGRIVRVSDTDYFVLQLSAK
jgi:hypothetical protein